MTSQFRSRLLTSTLFMGVAVIATPAMAQTAETRLPSDEAGTVQGDIVVTGSRIARPNDISASPIAVVTGDQTVANADITLDTFLNTLPQVNPAGTTTSNNPGNGGQSNINLRGLGSNRNIVLIDGRRPMVSASDQTVDLNTIPQGLIERIEVVTGGAGATYGADAVAGVVNVRMKQDFSGVDLRATYSNSMPLTDAREYQLSGTIGGNFADDRGNFAFAVEYAKREGLIKSQRPFAAQATSTTGTPPVGRFVASSTNSPTQAAIDGVFAQYGVAAGAGPRSGSQIGFNNDGTLFGVGIFNSPINVTNFRYGQGSAANPNLNFFPDFYSYNFDIINLLVLPLERKSAFLKGNYKVNDSFDFFVQGGYTEYTSEQALAPTPVSTPVECLTGSVVARAKSGLVTCGRTVSALVVPTTNPFIPNDLRTILNSRTGDDASLVGAGATEPFRISKRFLDTGLRTSTFNNQVWQALGGLRGDISDNWRYEAYYSYGKTTINVAAGGNVNVQRVQSLLEAADGGASQCEGGFDPFGIKPLSAACVSYIDETGFTSTVFTQKIGQAFVSGDLFQLPGGTVSVVVGAEKRDFEYRFDPGVLSGPIAGFNTATPDRGTNSFTDFFGELLVPLVSGASFADSIEANFSYRRSRSDFNDVQNGVDGKPVGSDAYGATLTWAVNPNLRLRGSYQRSVRAPNFGELFSGGGSFPQIFDPCSANTNFRTTGGAAASSLCAATGVANPASFVATPGAQSYVGISGNTGLRPETSDTFTGGVVFSAFGIRGSVDYYNIRIKDPVFAPDPNLLIAACYGYFGINSNLSFANPYCSDGGQSNFQRAPDISSIVIPASLGGDANGYFQAVNSGSVKTSGIDVQLAYKLPTRFAGEDSALNFDLYANYLLDFKVQELPGVTLDYAGSASYFGAGLGTSFPRFKATGNIAWNFDPLILSTRIRYIDNMKNRAAVQFPGETFTGPGDVWYFDFALEAPIENMSFRIGVNNAFNRLPPTYAPNVQSGTDPSLYDVIGRRAYVSARLKF